MNFFERDFFDSVVHGLRSQGWSRDDAEDEALAKLERWRQKRLLWGKTSTQRSVSDA